MSAAFAFVEYGCFSRSRGTGDQEEGFSGEHRSREVNHRVLDGSDVVDFQYLDNHCASSIFKLSIVSFIISM